LRKCRPSVWCCCWWRSFYGQDSVGKTPQPAAVFLIFVAKRWPCFLIGYGFVASVLPVWLLLGAAGTTYRRSSRTARWLLLAVWHPRGSAGPQDARSHPLLSTAPVRCGPAVSYSRSSSSRSPAARYLGFHSLISSGTTPKMLENEKPGANDRLWAAMLTESFVAIMAMIGATVLETRPSILR